MYLNDLKKKEQIKASGLWKPLYVEDVEIGKVLLAVPPAKVAQATRDKITRRFKAERRLKQSADLSTEHEFEVFLLMLKEMYIKDWGPASDGTPFPVLAEGEEPLEFTPENVDLLLEISDIRIAMVEMVNAINEMKSDELKEDEGN